MTNPYSAPHSSANSPRKTPLAGAERIFAISSLAVGIVVVLTHVGPMLLPNAIPHAYWLGWGGLLWSITPPLYSLAFASLSLYASISQRNIARVAVAFAYIPVFSFAAWLILVLQSNGQGFLGEMGIWIVAMLIAIILVGLNAIRLCVRSPAYPGMAADNDPMQPSGEVGRFEVGDQPSPPADR